MAATAVSLFGVDFTSAPRRVKPIVIAQGAPDSGGVRVRKILRLTDWRSFEDFLAQPGPWLGGFDFPFGLPREAVEALGFPGEWAAMARHCAAMDRASFRAAFDAHRESRPVGARYAHRTTDRPAGSHSPMKLVNPPVGLMFLEGAPRLLGAGVTIPHMMPGDPARIAIEAYPGLLARELVSASYKSDEIRKQTPERRAARETIVARLCKGDHRLAVPLHADEAVLHAAIEDASGDTLDATLALVQAAWCWQRRDTGYGLPENVDPLEGWIATA